MPKWLSKLSTRDQGTSLHYYIFVAEMSRRSYKSTSLANEHFLCYRHLISLATFHTRKIVPMCEIVESERFELPTPMPGLDGVIEAFDEPMAWPTHMPGLDGVIEAFDEPMAWSDILTMTEVHSRHRPAGTRSSPSSRNCATLTANPAIPITNSRA